MSDSLANGLLSGRRVTFVGKLGGMSRRDAQQLVRGQGGQIAERLDATVDLLVVGEHELLSADDLIDDSLDGALRSRSESGELEIVSETELWQRLGLVDQEKSVRRLYTPAMLADLLGVAVSVVRRWHRRGLLVPAREVRRLAYFDFQEVANARRLAELLSTGISPSALERKLAALARFVPGARRSLAQLSVIVEGKQLLLRQADGLIDPQGQLRFDFGALSESSDANRASRHDASDGQRGGSNRLDSNTTEPQNEILSLSMRRPALDDDPVSADEMFDLAAELEDEGDLAAAIDMYRAALASSGPTAEGCFRLAELLYQEGDLAAARERYYMAVEIDEDYVEARANLGCVLAEMGDRELATAAFEGALRYHGEYPDAHYHLARTLDELGQGELADEHWAAFVALAPDSPWAEEAQERLSYTQPSDHS